ncbi:autotransporter-associated beta strand repeat-containing protein [Pseudoxanthomonas sp. JBR18]|uniref:autotransporter-associated beta strand repeat-containing protein n=1 Tax=Pseudoxanthomonas sp. JBR18 TaxID=2969308 RepID=UPI00230600DA|nr:autotransporter-associated beta strand repeat-containing protein [Pseudoxanthomonas sp. JBR18]WCE06284.1 autotransporter-associated beta strand repeat-containing protein [Pseudoxanthomonas sp. JBR18]
MNRIFKIVWNAALNQFVVASELVGSRKASGRSGGTRLMTPLRRGALVAALASVVPLVQAHTVSVGYIAPLGSNNTITFWYGTYHTTSDSGGQITFEGQFQLTGTNGFSQTVDFSQIAGSGQADPNRPVGLEDGANNFYAVSQSGSELTGVAPSAGRSMTWQGVTFSGLTAGTYTYTYLPIANPSAVWHPWDAVLSNTLVVTAADLNGFPMLPGHVYTQIDPELNQTDSIVFNGGTYAPTEDTTHDQLVTIRSGNGTVDTTGGDVTFTGGVDGTGALTKAGDGTLILDGNSTYTGGTTVQAGTLQGDTDSLQGDIANNGTVAFDQGSTGTYAGDMTGTGGLVKGGSGTLLLTGDNTYSGGTMVQSGTLQGDTGSLQGDIANNGTVAFNQGSTGTYAGDLSGTGSLVKGGSGTLVLTGDNTYSGGTTVQSGTLQGDTGSLQGDIANNGTVAFNQGGTGTYAGDMTGTGGLVKGGNGTLVLTGDNTYTGGTTVQSGTLQVSADGNLGDLSSGLVLNGGVLQTSGTFQTGRAMTLNGGGFAVDAGKTFTSTGTLAGSGGLVKNGAGTMVVGGNASHQGGTTVNAGTLILSGENTYTGGNTLNGGSLRIDRDANLGDASNAIIFNGGDLTVTSSITSSRDMVIGAGNASITTLDGVTLNAQGDMSGTGGLFKRGNGTLVVSGNNTFTGGTLIDGGVIKIDSGSSLGTGTIVLSGGTLQTVQSLGTGQTVLISGDSGVNVDAGTSTELSGQILTDGDAGCFVKSGQGTLNMTGRATLAHGTCVQEGLLRANGMLTSQVQVDAIGTLRGVGVIDGDVHVDGILAPGNSPGTLTVNGAVTMTDASTLQIDIDGYGTEAGAGNYSRLLVGGVYTAAGTLAPTLRGITGNASNTFTPELGDVYTIVQAQGGVQGSFDTLLQPTAGLADNTRFQVFYANGNTVELYVTPASYVTLLDGVGNGNAVRAGEAVDRMMAAQDGHAGNANQPALLQALAGLRAAALPAVMQGLAGEVHAHTAAMAREAGLGLIGDMGDHLAEAQVGGADHGSRAWATLSQDGSRTNEDANASGYRTHQDRATAGVDIHRGEASVWGVGVAHTESKLVDTEASGSVRGNGVLLYGEVAVGRVLIDGTASWSKDDWRMRRADPLSPAMRLASQADGHSTAASVTARLPFQHGSLRIEPMVQATWQRVDRDGFSESGDALTNLEMDRYDETGTRVLAGLNVGSAAQDPLASTVTFRVGAAVGREFGNTYNPTVDATLAGESFAVDAPAMGRNLYKLDASGTVRIGQRSYLYGGLGATQGHNRSSHEVNAGVRVQF